MPQRLIANGRAWRYEAPVACKQHRASQRSARRVGILIKLRSGGRGVRGVHVFSSARPISLMHSRTHRVTRSSLLKNQNIFWRGCYGSTTSRIKITHHNCCVEISWVAQRNYSNLKLHYPTFSSGHKQPVSTLYHIGLYEAGTLIRLLFGRVAQR